MRANNIPEFWISRRLSQLKGDEGYMKQIETLSKWDFKNPVSITMLSNITGIGKTHIAMCLYRKYVYGYVLKFGNEIQSANFNCFVKESHLYRRIQDTYTDKSFEKEKDVITEYANKNFLVIDDMFSSRDNEFARQKMLDIIDMRIDWNRKATIITSNLSIDDIKKVDSRIASRLTNGLIINFKSGIDKRYLNTQQ